MIAVTADILCDCAVKEEGSGKHTLVGIYSAIVLNDEALGKHICITSYWSLIGIEDSAILDVELVHTDGSVIAEGSMNLLVKDPSDHVDVVAKLSAAFPSFGDYCLRLSHRGAVIRQRRFSVRRKATDG